MCHLRRTFSGRPGIATKWYDLLRRGLLVELFEQNDEWQTDSRYMQIEAFAQIDQEETDPIPSIETA